MTHYHIVGKTSDGMLAVGETTGHAESRPPMEQNYYASRGDANNALLRWRFHFIQGREQIMQCDLKH